MCAQMHASIAHVTRYVVQLIREGLKDRVTRLPPVSAAFRDRLDADAWGPSVKYILADDIPQLEREDFKRMRPLSRPTLLVTPPPQQTARPNRPPKPVNTFLMFCRYGGCSCAACEQFLTLLLLPDKTERRSWLTTPVRAPKMRPRFSAICGKSCLKRSELGTHTTDGVMVQLKRTSTY